ncbi:type III pantothenate kinase (plasmid) [Pedobacter sp. BS3]|uniref:type III pantothenate kinase n=1 Tax=Pedobacter sp. BS3 TaxID=2567937 RepID=UPI0011EC641C|nr:type III pantothenate kinase [Pedobacter sp. BS3]TZF86327.1 type III pantothenate kinase [Pedobacter sp. BS3]
MVSLVIDIGNTFTKLAIFNNRTIAKTVVLEQFNIEMLREHLAAYPVTHSVISSVDADVTAFEALLQQETRYQRFNSTYTAGIKNHYKTPGSLGLDRLAAVIGASAEFPNRNSLVIDAGTCITYDLVDADKNYFGGSISPGLAMRYQAMHTFTQRLPSVNFSGSFNSPYGDDTPSAMQSGVQNGLLFEVSGFIESYKKTADDLQVILCGGDFKFFDTRLKNSIFAPIVKADPYLVLKGLNEVIHYYNA